VCQWSHTRPTRSYLNGSLLISSASVAVGELGDKTQPLSLILATRLRRLVPIIAGIFVATLLNRLVAWWIGEWAGKLISPQLSRWLLGHSFDRTCSLGTDPGQDG
jgi:putative Ca2+/H+ antiporter (TMEM165/GDT1 family)